MEKGVYEVLSETDMDTILDAVYELLNVVGARFDPDPRVLDLLSSAGCDVSSKGTVKYPREVVERALDSAKRETQICDRNGNVPDVKGISFTAGMTCVNVIDLKTREQRPSTREDLAIITRVVDALPLIDFVYPTCKIVDRSNVRGDIEEFAVLATNTTKPIGWLSEFPEALEAVIEIASVIRGGKDKLKEKPYFSFDICPMPLYYSQKEIDQLFVALGNDIPVRAGSESLGGANAPITIAGSLVHNLATDFGILVLAQLIKKGCYFGICTEAGFMDPKTGNSGGLPESLLCELARNQIYQKLDFPSSTAAGTGRSFTFDQYSASTVSATMLHAFFSGAGGTGYLGSIEGGMTFSLHSLLFCHEMAGMIRRMEKGIEVNKDTLAMETTRKVGLSCNYLAEMHTAIHCRTELWQPRYYKSCRREEWGQKGKKDLIDIIDEDLQEILATHRPEPLPDQVKKQIDDMLIKYGVIES
jgi:trimethylamine--corrinoid protein Co-methyltransferase